MSAIYIWKLGDVALARICKKVYAKVKVVKDEHGLFHDVKVLGITCNEDGSMKATKQLCYYVETMRTKQQLWIPYTSLHLAERGRPFYGQDRVTKVSPPKAGAGPPKKRKIKEDHTLPFDVLPSKYKEPDLNATYDFRHTPLKQGKYENAFKEFVRRGKEMLFDSFYSKLEVNDDRLDYLINIDASTEDKYELIISNIVTEKEIENYLHQCWRYNFVYKQMGAKDDKEDTASSSLVRTPATIHISWCLVCGKGEKLRLCPNCPSAFHLACRREWLIKIIHRKQPPTQVQKPVTLISKILSSTRTICSVHKDKENMELCPSCMWGPKVGYDDVVWHKLGTCAWWPARVLTPGETPSCLLSRSHAPHEWPLRYYGT
ncbi:uncharacterized protein [Choristoneura fumiferana]